MPMDPAAHQLLAWHPIKDTAEYRRAWDRILAADRHDFT